MLKIHIKIAAIFAFAVFVAPFLFSNESAAAGIQKGVYYPNTEKLAPDEMRIISLGTGLPAPLTKNQKSSSWLVELGNGDIFVFDCGTGSMENMFALQPRFAEIDKVFVSHLHSDHVGDVDALWVGGWGSGRYTPLHINGPSGATPELGTKAFVEGLKKAYAWDTTGRSGAWPDAGGQLIAHEFDYKQETKSFMKRTVCASPLFPPSMSWTDRSVIGWIGKDSALFLEVTRFPTNGS